MLETNNRVIYSYNGEMNNAILNNILYSVEHKMKEAGEKQPFIKKLNSVLIECCQNLIHHTEKTPIPGLNTYPAVMIARTDVGYTITTRNLVKKETETKLKNYLDFINAMDKDQLRAYYNEVLTNGQISNKGGGGLGIINIIRKTQDLKIHYVFETGTDDKVFFNMSINVSEK